VRSENAIILDPTGQQDRKKLHEALMSPCAGHDRHPSATGVRVQGIFIR
jgi:hypothetical protein